MLPNFQEHLEYCPLSGHLTWIKPTGPTKRGSIAGCRANGYIQVRLHGQLYYAHQIAYFLHTNQWCDKQIDHINGNGFDNRWVNLRPVTRQQNGQNSALSRNNTSGVTGVFWDKRKSKWGAKITLNYRGHFLGYFDSIEDAAKVRKQAEAKHGFHPNHGRAA